MTDDIHPRLLMATAEGAVSLLLDVQKECIQMRVALQSLYNKAKKAGFEDDPYGNWADEMKQAKEALDIGK